MENVNKLKLRMYNEGLRTLKSKIPRKSKMHLKYTKSHESLTKNRHNLLENEFDKGVPSEDLHG